MKKITLLFVLCMAVMTAGAQDWSKIAFLSEHIDLEDFNNNADDDEKGAGHWLIGKGGVFVSLEQIKNGSVNLADFKALWIHLDRQIIPGNEENPVDIFVNDHLSPYKDTDVLNAITNFYKAGGNLYLGMHASHYLVDLGRFHIRPEINGFGSGGNNEDVWYTTATYGVWLENPVENVIDHSNDPIFDGLISEQIRRPNGEEYKRFPLIGAGNKEDHNCFWNTDVPQYGNGDANKFTEFYNLYKATPLATWDHVIDYYGGAIIRWDAKDDYQGKCITVGLAAYEWNQNSGANTYQSNIEKLTENILKELAPVDGGGTTKTSTITKNEIKAFISNDILFVNQIENLISIELYDLSGKPAGKYFPEEVLNGINLSEHTTGIYIVRLNKKEDSPSVQKIIR